MSVDRENTWNEIVKKGYGYAGNEIGDNQTTISCLSWAALPVTGIVPFCTFDTHNPKISSNSRSPHILERKGGVFKPPFLAKILCIKGSKAHFYLILNISLLV